jgi:alginate O-acetyltransferase complex protein AlgI
MVFSSLLFLFIFLPIVILVYFISPRKYRNLILFISSLIFYAWGEPVYILAMLFSSLVDYTHGILIEKYRYKKVIPKIVLISSIVINLSLLGFFKYYDFFIIEINSIFNTSFRVFNLPLPIGISFYTFQTMSYTIDVYRGKFPAQKNIINFGTYVSLFSQLIAGPIVLYENIATELKYRKESIDSFAEGVVRFVIGLGKKVLIANNIGLLWDEVQRLQFTELTVITAWLGISAFAFQIYFDFSGYSDMAIGLSKMFGFKFPENFNYPYISKSITEFWRRWHMSLGGWFREYVYIPLGGNRCSTIKIYRNLFIVWFLTGLWHGASWNYVLWGLYFGFIIALEKAILLKYLNRLPSVVGHFYALLIILISWVFFSIEDLSKGFNYLKAMFGLLKIDMLNSQGVYFLYNYGIVFLIAILASTPIPFKFMEKLKNKFKKAYYVTTISAVAAIMFLSTAYLVDASYNPFLYFRF